MCLFVCVLVCLFVFLFVCGGYVVDFEWYMMKHGTVCLFKKGFHAYFVVINMVV